VKRDHGLPEEGGATSHATRCTIVMRAAQTHARGRASAIAELCRLHWYPLHIFARRLGHSSEDAHAEIDVLSEALIASEGRLGP
jgi:hypothetical protein